MNVIEYDDKYLEDVKDLLVELEEYILSIDRDNLDQLHPEYRDKMAILDLEEVNDNLGKCYLAIDNSKVLGVIMGVLRSYDEYDYLDYKCPRCGVITELVVSKTARGKGIGKLLISKMEEYFKSINCEYITVDIFAYNTKGIKFYEKEGYHTRGLIDIKNISKEHINYKCLIANKEMIIKKWDEEIKKHNNSELWTNFKEQSLRNINTRIVYMGLLGDEIIAEATAVVSSDDLDMQNKEGLVDDKKAYLTAFRTNKEYENKRYFSKLYKYMEEDLKKKGFTSLTLGVEPSEIRNIQIYFKWGFTKYIKTDYEFYSDDEKIIVNYYEKKLM